MSTLMDGTLTKIIGKNNPDSSSDKLTINSDLVVKGKKDVKFHGATPGNHVQWDSSADTLKLVGDGIHITQLGDNDYHPKLNFYNYDADNSSSEGMSNINFYNSKSDTEAYVATDADAHLGRLVWHASTGDSFKYASTINCRQTSAYGSGSNVGSELKFTTNAQQADGSTQGTSMCWAPPATPAANNRANLIINGTSTNLDQACASQLVIKNGTPPSAHTDNYIYIGSKDSAGTGTDTLATLSLFLEEGVDATALDAVGTLTTRIPVWVNGTCYWLYLEPV